MIAALVITGSEMLSGFRQDALVQPFAAQLKAKGMPVNEVRMIGDAPELLVKAVTEVVADFVVVTGGLGLTPDDTTHKAVAALNGSGEEFSIVNPVGSALGIDLRLKGKRVVFLPGVPSEASAMFANIMQELPDAGPATVNVPIFGLREIDIATRLGPLADQCGYLPKDMEVTLVVPVGIESEVRSVLGQHCLEESDISTAICALLAKRGLTFAAAESCTGGLIGHLITQISGSSRFFLGSIVAYSNAVKEKALDVQGEMLAAYGAVSEEVALAMLKGVLALTGADVGVATTGIAGPTGGTAEKPVGTIWIAVGTREKSMAMKFQFTFGRYGNKLISAKGALNLLRLFIYDQDLHRTAFA